MDTPPPKPALSPLIPVIGVIVFIFLVLTIGFQYWQNRQIQAQLSRMMFASSTTPPPVSTPAPAPTASWQVYRYQTFSFNYPSDYSLEDSHAFMDGDVIAVGIQSPPHKTGGGVNVEKIVVMYVSKPVKTTAKLENWWRSSVYGKEALTNNVTLEKTAIDGREALRYRLCGEGCVDTLFTQVNGNVYGIMLPTLAEFQDLYTPAQLQTIRENVDHILSTLAFTSARPTTVQSTLKTNREP